MSTAPRIERAIVILRNQGHDVSTPVVGGDGIMRIPIDGIIRTFDEVYQLAKV